MSAAESVSIARRPELIFGLVGPVGTDLGAICQQLRDVLAQVNYRAEEFRLSRFMREIKAKPWSELKNDFADEELRSHIKAGNDLRMRLGRQDAVAMLGVAALREFRKSETGDTRKPMSGFAAIVRSLKRPEEIETLKKIYGPAFIVLAAYSPRAERVRHLARRIAESHHSNHSRDYLAQAEQLVGVDEAEIENIYGQDVRDAFALADVIVNSYELHQLGASLKRFIELLFGNTLHTPTSDEQGMYLAQAAAFRSASLARQVGAAICRPDGSVIGVGCNEVSRAGGGQYWPGDEGDGRDFRLGRDSSDGMRSNLLADILERLKAAGWLVAEKATLGTTELVKQLVTDNLPGGNIPIMKGAQFTATIDYVRATHAEMAAIADAARSGTSTSNAELFTTTFPCHDCAKHVVAVGIRRVIYIEPYPKSLVADLFTDSISVDATEKCGSRVRFEPFVGIAPNRYAEWFALSKRRRKRKDGAVEVWRPNEAIPQLPDSPISPAAWLTVEAEEFKRFEDQLQNVIQTEGAQNEA